MIIRIVRFLLASGLYIVLLAGLYFGVAQWISAVNQSPEYKLISVTQAIGACDVDRFNQAVNLNAVIKNLMQNQLKAELDSQNNIVANGMIDEAMIENIMAGQIGSMSNTFETNLAKCNFMSLDAKKMPFWLVPTLHLLVSTRSVLNIASIRHSKQSADKQTASFTLRVDIPQLKNAEMAFQLVKKQKTTLENEGDNPWIIVGIKLNAEALTKVTPAPPKP
jgi:hypothetical protein